MHALFQALRWQKQMRNAAGCAYIASQQHAMQHMLIGRASAHLERVCVFLPHLDAPVCRGRTLVCGIAELLHNSWDGCYDSVI